MKPTYDITYMCTHTPPPYSIFCYLKEILFVVQRLKIIQKCLIKIFHQFLSNQK